jgi:hypothetical protein
MGKSLLEDLKKANMERTKGSDTNISMWTSAQIGQKMMRGQPFNILEMVQSTEPKRSDYQTTYMGLQNQSRTKKADFDKESLQNNIIPDPTMMKRL